MLELDINLINNYFDKKVNCLHHYNPTKYPIIYGYNCAFSGRSIGKTTNLLAWCLCAFQLQGCKTMYVKTNRTQTTRKYVETLFNTINIYKPIDKERGHDGTKNYVEIITEGKYNKVYYMHSQKRWFLINTNEQKKPDETSPVFMYLTSIDNSFDLRSSHNDIEENIVFYDECIDNYVTNDTFLQFAHIIKTCFTSRCKAVVFITGNLSTGRPAFLQSMGIYQKMLGEQKPFKIYTTELNTKIAVELCEPTDDKIIEYANINTAFFGFNIPGMEVVRGQTIAIQEAKKLPELLNGEKWDIIPTPIYFYVMGYWLRAFYCVCESWQPMYLIRYTTKALHNGTDYTLTDDLIYSRENPYTFFNKGSKNKLAVAIAKEYSLNNLCYEDNMCEIAINSFYEVI